MTDAPLIFVVAGEASGDLLGGRLMAALKEETGGAVRFAGVGGETMQAQGLTSLFPMAELSIMGLAEVLPHLPRLMRRISETAAEATRLKPAAVVTIDSPGFNFRLGKRLAGKGIALVHYVAPSVWAWKPGRARKIAEFLDHLLALLPFEPPLFTAVGLPTTFVGHSVIEAGLDRGDGLAFRRRHGIPEDAPVLCVLPGSRRSETSRLLPVFAETLALLKQRHPTLHAIVPTVSAVAASVTAAAAHWPVPSTVLADAGQKADAFAASDGALAASGTVSLELTLARVPTVIAYRVNPITAWLVRGLLKVKYVTLVNILLQREVVPERIQDACTAPILTAEVDRLLTDPEVGREQIAAAGEALRMLGQGEEPPSRRAARAILDVIARRTEAGRVL